MYLYDVWYIWKYERESNIIINNYFNIHLIIVFWIIIFLYNINFIIIISHSSTQYI